VVVAGIAFVAVEMEKWIRFGRRYISVQPD
jgi:hypothetical protein